eukprot:7401296-Pyramimonas_sp.AAC.1
MAQVRTHHCPVHFLAPEGAQTASTDYFGSGLAPPRTRKCAPSEPNARSAPPDWATTSGRTTATLGCSREPPRGIS